MLEQYKVNAIKNALEVLFKDSASIDYYHEGDGEQWAASKIDLSDDDIRAFMESLEGIIGKENHDNK